MLGVGWLVKMIPGSGDESLLPETFLQGSFGGELIGLKSCPEWVPR